MKGPRIFLGGIVGLVLLFAEPGLAAAQDDHMMMHGAPDNRHKLDFPAPMREHMLHNMRGHLEALGEILSALADGDGARAAAIARNRLGVESPGAAACVKGDTSASGAATSDHMGAMMARFMPEDMRTLGRTMHESASAFANEAQKVTRASDAGAALAALSQVTQNCAACHAAYKMR